MLRTVGAHLASTTTWATVNTELHRDVADVVDRTPRVHNVTDHQAVYESVVDRTRPIRMLEIGSFYGDSVQAWRDYLHPDSLVVGVDVDSKFVKIAGSQGIRVRMVGAQTVSLLRDVAEEFGPFDVILDAGSQACHPMAENFGCLFETALTNDGVYVVEDVCCDYWTLYNSFSLAGLARVLSDVLHGHYQFATSPAKFRAGHLVVVRRTAAT
ncbi:hypothetical protein BHQ17_18495 [Mycolicibacterium holsaticum]|uniref:Methyltransferase n=1 Tax=Mycolicibacterium holsaticum TaxID=152142 RepID=A0A1E3REK5_9MYCO|nr:hypothetical protein BHQ17_18495 [Mycolicibacterium holsaticum]